MSLVDLPLELIQRILGQFCPHCQEYPQVPEDPPDWSTDSRNQTGRQALAQLSLVSKQLGGMAQAILYHHFGFIETHKHASFLFCRTIHENPKLGYQVCSMKVTLGPVKGVKLDKDIAWVKPLLRKLEQSPTCKHDWCNPCPPCEQIQDELMGYILPTLTVPQTPYLKNLWVTGGIDWFMFNHMYRMTEEDQQEFPKHLRHLHVHCPKSRHKYVWQFITTSLMPFSNGDFMADHPKLEGLTLAGSGSTPLPNSIGIQDLKFLRLYRPVFSREYLLRFILTPKNLQEFVFIDTESQFMLGGPRPGLRRSLNAQEVFEHLAAKNNTLRRATVMTPWNGKPLTAACRLTGLEELYINTCAMFNMRDLMLKSRSLDDFGLFNAMPPSIKVLHLEVEPYGLVCIEKAIVKYVASTYDHKTNTQTLKRLAVNLQTMEPEYGESALRASSFTPSKTDEEAAEGLQLLLKTECPEWLVDGKLEIDHIRAPEPEAEPDL